MKHIFSLALLAALLALPQPELSAQAVRVFKARLSSMPYDLATAPSMTGVGSVTATLTGARLTINGTFEGLSSPATVARLHKAQRGVRGPAVLDIKVSAGTSGTVTATLDLTALQVQDLVNGRLYVQLHSEKAPDGNLWGWLLPQEMKR